METLRNMHNLELQTNNTDIESDVDGDICDESEICETFRKTKLLSSQEILPSEYILHISGTIEQNPSIAATLSDNTCHVFNLDTQFTQINVLEGHNDTITGCKFSLGKNSILYTASTDGTIKVWDIRDPKKSSTVFADNESDKKRRLNCFDVSANEILLTAGTDLYDGDAFILFWDIRNTKLLGGYWESHTDDITQVKFDQDDVNKLISGSTDGLINIYDLSQENEDDALIDSLNTESSVERLDWVEDNGKYCISCLTHTADLQLWKEDEAEAYFHLRRVDIAKHMKRKSEDFIYLVNTHEVDNSLMVLTGSNFQDGECFRSLQICRKSINPSNMFVENKQRVRTSWFNKHTNLLITGGEKGILDAWKL